MFAYLPITQHTAPSTNGITHLVTAGFYYSSYNIEFYYFPSPTNPSLCLETLFYMPLSQHLPNFPLSVHRARHGDYTSFFPNVLQTQNFTSHAQLSLMSAD